MGKKVQKEVLFYPVFMSGRRKEVRGMTELQAERIRQLRQRGIGYRMIATEVGLTRDIVRNFCKSKGLNGYGAAIKVNIEEQQMLGKACLFCGREFEQPKTGRPRKFCSDRCRREWWKAHPDRLNKNEAAMYKMTCSRCGRTFVSYGNRNRKYCSHECYIKARFWEVENEDSRIESIAD